MDCLLKFIYKLLYGMQPILRCKLNLAIALTHGNPTCILLS